jgi:DNA-binding response OmpR family regulator
VEPSIDTPRPVVLVVEDDVIVQAGIARFLAHYGYRAVVADCVSDAMALARREDITAVTLDLSLRGGTGMDFLLWLRSTPAYRRTPVVILTGVPAVRPDDDAVIRSMGAAVVFKPTSYQTVLDKLLLTCSSKGAAA